MPLGAFLFVIALIPVALWAMKRAGVGGAATGGVLRHVANLGLGTAQQRVTVVEVTVGAERHWLVLGVTGEQVTNLASYAAPEASAPPPLTPLPSLPPHVVTVQQLLARWRAGKDAKGGHEG
jgi:flagellar protein FliO/FliZ